MPFIGQEPLTGAYHVLDAITTSATATYNLQLNSGAFSPATANQLLVSLNGVIQKPGSSFTISGSQITFSSALTSSDSIDFIIALGDVLSVGTPTDGSVNTAKIATDAVTSAKIATNAVGSDALDLTVVSGPTFKAHKTVGVAQDGISSLSSTKVLFQTELWDTASDYDTSNSRFTPSKAGYYLITTELQIEHAAATAAVLPVLRKNGSTIAEGTNSTGLSGVYAGSRSSWIVPMNGSSDYVEIFVYGQASGGTFNMADNNVYRNEFEGIWLRDL